MSADAERTEREPLVLVSREGAIATVTINRPGSLNAINDELRPLLTSTIAEVTADRDVRVLVLTGAGRAFCAGGDIKSMRERLDAPSGRVAIDGWRRQHRTAALVRNIHEAPLVTIAAVNGAAMGLGMDLALACDFIVAAPEAKFGAAFVKRGLIPDGGGMYFLPRRVGLSTAKQLMFSGRTVGAEEALALGIADLVTASGETLLAETVEFAAQFAENPSTSIALMKGILDRTYETTLGDVAQMGSQAQAIAYTTEEHRASVEAFLKKD